MVRGMSSSHRLILAALFVSVAASACQDATDAPDPSGTETTDVASVRGVDYAWSHPAPSAIHGAGYAFAARYLSYDGGAKNLSPGESGALWANGVDVVVVFEENAENALGGYGQGVADARLANDQSIADGIPPGRPIYFAIDFDATEGQQPTIDAYFDGVASVIGRARAGAYGGFYPVSRLFDAGKIAWGWQTYAWSGGQWDSRAQLRQVDNGVSVGGSLNCCDADQSVAADFGQWHATTVGTDGCTAIEDHDAALFGCDCVNHAGNGGACAGTGCTSLETRDAADFGCACVDHEANGGFCEGTGCTLRETDDALHFGCACVDHEANGGVCAGTGCTPRETEDAAKFGCGCVDHKANGGACPGTGCTVHETDACEHDGKTCALHVCK